jgi:hypothetical protein
MPAPEPPTMRERYRAQVRAEVKQAALSPLAESGPAGLSVSAIGKQLGVSGPALYRYFAGCGHVLPRLLGCGHWRTRPASLREGVGGGHPCRARIGHGIQRIRGGHRCPAATSR